MGLTIVINGQNRSFEELQAPVTLASLIGELNLKGDRIAVECNGEIVEREQWAGTKIESGDQLEIVHFVGGGSRDCGEAPEDGAADLIPRRLPPA
jgi:sulfur carrier protein